MRRFILCALLISALVRIAVADCAEVRVGENCTMRWVAPTQNADGTPLTDLKEYRVYVRDPMGIYPTTPAGPAIQAPTTQTTCEAIGVVKDGTYAAVVKAVDTQGNQSVASNEVQLVRDTQSPGAPQMFEIMLQLQGTIQLTPK